MVSRGGGVIRLSAVPTCRLSPATITGRRRPRDAPALPLTPAATHVMPALGFSGTIQILIRCGAETRKLAALAQERHAKLPANAQQCWVNAERRQTESRSGHRAPAFAEVAGPITIERSARSRRHRSVGRAVGRSACSVGRIIIGSLLDLLGEGFIPFGEVEQPLAGLSVGYAGCQRSVMASTF